VGSQDHHPGLRKPIALRCPCFVQAYGDRARRGPKGVLARMDDDPVAIRKYGDGPIREIE
jgi:hypothetical protein